MPETDSVRSLSGRNQADVTERALERDYYMTAEEALAFGIVDKIVQKRPAATA